MRNAVDYSFSRPDLACLAAQGVRFAGRYLAHEGAGGKAVSREEIAALHAADLGVFLYAQTSGGSPAFSPGGVAFFSGTRGRNEGHLFAAELRALGAPAGTAAFWAVDYDAQDGDVGAIGYQLDQFADELEALGYLAGVYGSYRVCWNMRERYGTGARVLLAQTTAWSAGQILQAERGLPGLTIYQRAPGVEECGGQVDWCEVFDVGSLWLAPTLEARVRALEEEIADLKIARQAFPQSHSHTAEVTIGTHRHGHKARVTLGPGSS